MFDSFTSEDGRNLLAACLFVIISWAIVHLSFWITSHKTKNQIQEAMQQQDRDRRRYAEVVFRLMQDGDVTLVQTVDRCTKRMWALTLNADGSHRTCSADEEREFADLNGVVHYAMLMLAVQARTEASYDAVQPSQ
jgi:hypothetical protein